MRSLTRAVSASICAVERGAQRLDAARSACLGGRGRGLGSDAASTPGATERAFTISSAGLRDQHGERRDAPNPPRRAVRRAVRGSRRSGARCCGTPRRRRWRARAARPRGSSFTWTRKASRRSCACWTVMTSRAGPISRARSEHHEDREADDRERRPSRGPPPRGVRRKAGSRSSRTARDARTPRGRRRRSPSSSASPWAAETKPASNADGAR